MKMLSITVWISITKSCSYLGMYLCWTCYQEQNTKSPVMHGMKVVCCGWQKRTFNRVKSISTSVSKVVHILGAILSYRYRWIFCSLSWTVLIAGIFTNFLCELFALYCSKHWSLFIYLNNWLIVWFLHAFQLRSCFWNFFFFRRKTLQSYQSHSI